MDSPDLDTLLGYFSDRINLIQDLIPLTRLVEEQIKKEASSTIFFAPTGMTITAAPLDTSADGSRTSSDISSSFAQSDVFSDMQSLAKLVVEMQQMVRDINERIEAEKSCLDSQEERIKMRIGGLRAHLKYLKDNFVALKRPAAVANGESKLSGQKAVNGAKIIDEMEEATETVTIPIETELSKKVKNGSANGNKIVAKSSVTTVKKNGQVAKTGTIKKKSASVNVPKVTDLTQEEFDSVPGYQKGRLTLETVNKSVLDFNKAMAAKYRLMSAPNRNTEAEIKKYQMYKSQENAETKGEYFVTSADLKELSELKADNTTKLVLQCLRHCKRIKEIRGPAKLIRFAVCN